MQDLMSVSLRSAIFGNSGKRKFFEVQFFFLIRLYSSLNFQESPGRHLRIPSFFRQHARNIQPALGIYIGKKEFKNDFWTTEAFLRSQKPNYIKWQQAWKNRIKHCTPRVTPEYDDVPVDGVIEKWDPRLKTSQIKTIKISPMFGADVVQLYKKANEAHPATTVVKSQEAAESSQR